MPASFSYVPRRVTPRDFIPPCIALAACLSLACADEKDPLDSATHPTVTTTNPSDGSNASNASNATDDSDGTAASEATDTGVDETTVPTTGEPTTGTTAIETTAAETTSTTEPAPTDGPGVLPGEDGMQAFCRRYKECGGTYYDDQQECLDATYGYWGDCPSRKAALDDFGACMSELECGAWNPDAYNPNDTPCAQQWAGVEMSAPC
ncbi:hypothetical protein SAMN02745121_05940 [Nannocystis exedens]|uniref:Uncharacterized protein n=1 Tax=Nannocystis exedens TaxID=54 RepID=A0A1I2E9G6_9BACT|nr:hypothetical protein NAEX_07981 [Nannocystis exedens]SFE89333.1 hypothetical protein SAMN02745121_05940 [Nannocystis exedens]